MANITRVQMDDNNEFIDADASGAVETSDGYRARRADENARIAINPHQHRQSIQMGGEAARQEQLEGAQRRVDQLWQRLDTLDAQSTAGLTPNGSMLMDLQNEFNDIAIAYVEAGGDINDSELVGLRNQVTRVSANVRLNRRS